MSNEPDDWELLKREARLVITSLLITLARKAVPKDLGCIKIQAFLASASLAVVETP